MATRDCGEDDLGLSPLVAVAVPPSALSVLDGKRLIGSPVDVCAHTRAHHTHSRAHSSTAQAGDAATAALAGESPFIINTDAVRACRVSEDEGHSRDYGDDRLEVTHVSHVHISSTPECVSWNSDGSAMAVGDSAGRLHFLQGDGTHMFSQPVFDASRAVPVAFHARTHALRTFASVCFAPKGVASTHRPPGDVLLVVSTYGVAMYFDGLNLRLVPSAMAAGGVAGATLDCEDDASCRVMLYGAGDVVVIALRVSSPDGAVPTFVDKVVITAADIRDSCGSLPTRPLHALAGTETIVGVTAASLVDAQGADVREQWIHDNAAPRACDGAGVLDCTVLATTLLCLAVDAAHGFKVASVLTPRAAEESAPRVLACGTLANVDETMLVAESAALLCSGDFAYCALAGVADTGAVGGPVAGIFLTQSLTTGDLQLHFQMPADSMHRLRALVAAGRTDDCLREAAVAGISAADLTLLRIEACTSRLSANASVLVRGRSMAPTPRHLEFDDAADAVGDFEQVQQRCWEAEAALIRELQALTSNLLAQPGTTQACRAIQALLDAQTCKATVTQMALSLADKLGQQVRKVAHDADALDSSFDSTRMDFFSRRENAASPLREPDDVAHILAVLHDSLYRWVTYNLLSDSGGSNDASRAGATNGFDAISWQVFRSRSIGEVIVELLFERDAEQLRAAWCRHASPEAVTSVCVALQSYLDNAASGAKLISLPFSKCAWLSNEIIAQACQHACAMEDTDAHPALAALIHASAQILRNVQTENTLARHEDVRNNGGDESFSLLDLGASGVRFEDMTESSPRIPQLSKDGFAALCKGTLPLVACHADCFDTTCDCSSSLSIVAACSHILELAETHDLHMTLDEYLSDSVADIAMRLVDRVDQAGALPSQVDRHLRPFCSKHGLDCDAFIADHIHELCGVLNDNKEVLLDRILALIPCIESPVLRCTATLLAAQTCSAPHVPELYEAVAAAGVSCPARADEARQAERLMRIHDILHKYGISRRFNILESHAPRALVHFLSHKYAVRGCLEDLVVLCNVFREQMLGHNIIAEFFQHVVSSEVAKAATPGSDAEVDAALDSTTKLPCTLLAELVAIAVSVSGRMDATDCVKALAQFMQSCADNARAISGLQLAPATSASSSELNDASVARWHHLTYLTLLQYVAREALPALLSSIRTADSSGAVETITEGVARWLDVHALRRCLDLNRHWGVLSCPPDLLKRDFATRALDSVILMKQGKLAEMGFDRLASHVLPACRLLGLPDAEAYQRICRVSAVAVTSDSASALLELQSSHGANAAYARAVKSVARCLERNQDIPGDPRPGKHSHFPVCGTMARRLVAGAVSAAPVAHIPHLLEEVRRVRIANALNACSIPAAGNVVSVSNLEIESKEQSVEHDTQLDDPFAAAAATAHAHTTTVRPEQPTQSDSRIMPSEIHPDWCLRQPSPLRSSKVSAFTSCLALAGGKRAIDGVEALANHIADHGSPVMALATIADAGTLSPPSASAARAHHSSIFSAMLRMAVDKLLRERVVDHAWILALMASMPVRGAVEAYKSVLKDVLVERNQLVQTSALGLDFMCLQAAQSATSDADEGTVSKRVNRYAALMLDSAVLLVNSRWWTLMEAAGLQAEPAKFRFPKPCEQLPGSASTMLYLMDAVQAFAVPGKQGVVGQPGGALCAAARVALCKQFARSYSVSVDSAGIAGLRCLARQAVAGSTTTALMNCAKCWVAKCLPSNVLEDAIVATTGTAKANELAELQFMNCVLLQVDDTNPAAQRTAHIIELLLDAGVHVAPGNQRVPILPSLQAAPWDILDRVLQPCTVAKLAQLGPAIGVPRDAFHFRLVQRLAARLAAALVDACTDDDNGPVGTTLERLDAAWMSSVSTTFTQVLHEFRAMTDPIFVFAAAVAVAHELQVQFLTDSLPSAAKPGATASGLAGIEPDVYALVCRRVHAGFNVISAAANPTSVAVSVQKAATLAEWMTAADSLRRPAGDVVTSDLAVATQRAALVPLRRAYVLVAHRVVLLLGAASHEMMRAAAAVDAGDSTDFEMHSWLHSVLRCAPGSILHDTDTWAPLQSLVQAMSQPPKAVGAPPFREGVAPFLARMCDASARPSAEECNGLAQRLANGLEARAQSYHVREVLARAQASDWYAQLLRVSAAHSDHSSTAADPWCQPRLVHNVLSLVYESLRDELGDHRHAAPGLLLQPHDACIMPASRATHAALLATVAPLTMNSAETIEMADIFAGFARACWQDALDRLQHEEKGAADAVVCVVQHAAAAARVIADGITNLCHDGEARVRLAVVFLDRIVSDRKAITSSELPFQITTAQLYAQSIARSLTGHVPWLRKAIPLLRRPSVSSWTQAAQAAYVHVSRLGVDMKVSDTCAPLAFIRGVARDHGTSASGAWLTAWLLIDRKVMEVDMMAAAIDTMREHSALQAAISCADVLSRDAAWQPLLASPRLLEAVAKVCADAASAACCVGHSSRDVDAMLLDAIAALVERSPQPHMLGVVKLLANVRPLMADGIATTNTIRSWCERLVAAMPSSTMRTQLSQSLAATA